MKIIIIGVGYVGLVTGVMLSELGHNIICIDNNVEKISKLNDGIIPIYEEGIKEYLINNIAKGRLHFFSDYNEYCQDAEVIFITVDTPSENDGSVNLKNLFGAIDHLIKNLDQNKLIILKSTVPPGTNANVKNYLVSKGYNFDIASNPEFLREGNAVKDFLNTDRIVIGISSKIVEDKFRIIYQKLIEKSIPLIITDPKSAELIKYVANSFLAIKIAFINEMSDLCERIDANIDMLAEGIGLDKRIGKEFLKVGPGFGGSCFPKDVNGLLKVVEKYDVKSFLLNAALESNEARSNTILIKVKKILGNNLLVKKIFVLGLAFKAGTDDIRESPSITIIKLLLKEGADINAYDPQARKNTEKLNLPINLVNSFEEGIDQVNAILILTEWPEFRNIDLAYAKNIMKELIIIDCRNIIPNEKLLNSGFQYYPLGKNCTILETIN